MADQNRTWGETAVLNSRTFSRFAGRALEARMTVRGAVHRTAVLLAIVVASAIASWGVALSDVAGDFWVPFGLAALAGSSSGC
jgi:uncharacterized YccA/Bax inhibitor family protein